MINARIKSIPISRASKSPDKNKTQATELRAGIEGTKPMPMARAQARHTVQGILKRTLFIRSCFFSRPKQKSLKNLKETFS